MTKIRNISVERQAVRFRDQISVTVVNDLFLDVEILHVIYYRLVYLCTLQFKLYISLRKADL